MGDWIRTNYDWLIGVAIGIAGCLVAWLVYLKERRTKSLDWELLIDQRLVVHPVHADASLTVQYDEEPVDDPRLIVVRISNSGSEPILEGDFQGDGISITVPGAEVVSVDVVQASAPDILEPVGYAMLMGQDNWSLPPVLLNRQEWVDVQLIVDGGRTRRVNVSARLVGQTRPPRKRTDQDLSPFFAGSTMASLIVAFLGLMLFRLILDGPEKALIPFGDHFWVYMYVTGLVLVLIVIPFIPRVESFQALMDKLRGDRGGGKS